MAIFDSQRGHIAVGEQRGGSEQSAVALEREAFPIRVE